MTGEDFCLNFKDNSTSITWPPQGNHRHPWWCTISITTIVLSSVINNAFLMFRLISYYGLYCKILGLSCLAETENSSAKYAVRTVIFLLFCIQLLPVTWLCLLVYSEYLNLDGNRKGMRERQKLLFTTVAFKMFFTVTEDIPQLFLQILFLYRALTGLEEGMDNALSLTAILGITMSCLNGAWSSRFGIEDKPSRVAAALVTTVTLFSRVGVITIRSGFVLYILVPALMLYELTNWNIKNTDMDVPDIFRKEQADIDITHGDNAENDVTNNRSSFIERLRDYSWRCIDGLLFDGTSVRGVFVTIMYLFISLFMLMVDKEKFHIYQWFSIMLSINLFAIFNYTPIEANMNKR
ncbi:unnamed protein product [Meganyctiphanes norvegica]|uniref:XK-related protein n=1 Tax=Meganyctiphanes norvegica TaxID=48144 RepID=A0AAV2RWE0_MEGNR